MNPRTATKSISRVIALVIATSLAIVGLAATPAVADRPIEFTDSVTFPDVNPCTGQPMEVTIHSAVRLQEKRNGNVVVHVQNTGTTDDGFVMDHGTQSFVFNGNVARGAFTDNWRHADGSAFKAQGVFVEKEDGIVVDNFRLRCL